VSPRRLVLVSGLTLADYLLWNSSIGGGNSVLAIISGLSLVPLVLGTASLFVLSVVRLLTGRGSARPVRVRAAPGDREARLAPMRADGTLRGEVAARGSRAAAAARTSSDKIAA